MKQHENFIFDSVELTEIGYTKINVMKENKIKKITLVK